MRGWLIAFAWTCTVILPPEGWFGWMQTATTRDYEIANAADIWIETRGYLGTTESMLHVRKFPTETEPGLITVLRGDQWGGYACVGEDDGWPVVTVEATE